MKVTPELLRRYSRGECTEAEIQLVEHWLAFADDDAILSEEDIGNSPERIRDKLFPALFRTEGRPETKVPVVPLYKRLMRYAAVACIAMVFFAVGQLSVTTTYAKPMVNLEPKDLLYVYGMRNVHSTLSGEEFHVQIEGTIKLHNGSMAPKRITCGDQQFVLEPYHTYYLSGSDSAASLSDNSRFSDQGPGNFSLKGDFSILRTND
ncbi:MAG: hypothetical protein AAF944_09010 [Bacteroidota bacterium]